MLGQAHGCPSKQSCQDLRPLPPLLPARACFLAFCFRAPLLARRGSGYGVAALCGGGGQGDALILRAG